MDVPTHAEVVEQIDSFLARHAMAPTTFGRAVLGEPSFVKTVRQGRVPGLPTLEKLRDFMRERDEGLNIAKDGGVAKGACHRLSAGER